jgi:hypothetical protein
MVAHTQSPVHAIPACIPRIEPITCALLDCCQHRDVSVRGLAHPEMAEKRRETEFSDQTRLDSARKKLSGEPAGEYWIVSRATESWPQGSTGAARQPSVRP